MNEPVLSAAINVGCTAVGAVLGVFLTELAGRLKEGTGRKREFSTIRRRVLTTLVLNDLGDKLLELKDYFDRNDDLLGRGTKGKANLAFYEKWFLGKGLGTFRGESPAGLWTRDEARQMVDELLHLTV